MMPFVQTAREMQRLADPHCPVCHGAGWYLREDKAPMRCKCIEQLELCARGHPFYREMFARERIDVASIRTASTTICMSMPMS